MDEIRMLIKEWKKRIDVVTKNIFDFDEEIYSKINKACYSGETKMMIEKAEEFWNKLMVSYLKLSEIISMAERLNSKIFRNTSEIKSFLEGKHFVGKSEKISTNERTLLDIPEKDVHVSIEQLLENMIRNYDNVREILTNILDAQAKIGTKLEIVNRELSSLETLERELGIKSEIHTMLGTCKSDPIGCVKEVEIIESKLAEYKKMIYTLDEERRHADKLLQETESILVELERLRKLSKTAIENTLLHISKPVLLQEPMDDETLKVLLSWKKTLMEHIRLGRFSAAKIGLQKLREECGLKLHYEKLKYEGNTAELNEMEELKGRFRALKVKADKKGFSLINSYTSLKSATGDAIEKHPFELQAAREAIKRFEEKLKELEKKGE